MKAIKVHFLLYVFVWMCLFLGAQPVSAMLCEMHQNNLGSTQLQFYSSGFSKSWTAVNSMNVKLLEVQSTLAHTTNVTYHIDIKVNDIPIAAWDHSVNTMAYQAYIHIERLLLTVAAGDTITYSVTSSSGNGYMSGLTYVKLCNDYYDDNVGNDCEASRLIDPNSIIPTSIDYLGDHDFFRITVEHSGLLIIFTSGSTDTYGFLYDANYVQLNADDDSGEGSNYRISKWVNPGTYYLSAKHYSTGTGTYTLNVQFLDENGLGNGQYGWLWGTGEHKDSLIVGFQSNGKDRLLHAQSYDIDILDEIAVYLNGILMGYLTGANGLLGPDSLWHIPLPMQVAGENTIEFRQKVSGYKWGVTRLGIFDMGSAFGNLKNLVGGDFDHGNGIELHIWGGEDRLLELTGWDSDYDDEIEIILNQQLLGGLPGAANNNWTNPYQLYLPQEYLNSGDNTILIHNKDSATYNWGIRLDAIRSGNAPLGHNVPGTVVNHTDEVIFLVPSRNVGADLEFKFYDVDTTTEIKMVINGMDSGYAPKTLNNSWGDSYPLSLVSDQLAVIKADNTLNPSTNAKWGIKIVNYMPVTDTDGDGLSDEIEILSCTDFNDADTDNDGIPDGIEDANHNGIKDAGETDPCNADTDNDGIPDGIEDTNHNGIKDAWETDPCNPDTDSDGILDGAEDKNHNGIVDPGETDPLISDTDGDTVSDKQDSAPLDAQNTGFVIVLPENTLDLTQHGWKWGDNAYYTILAATFISDNTDRLLHVQSYDIDILDEVSIYLNGVHLGYLSGANNLFGADSLWHFPVSLQKTGENTVEFQQKTGDYKWGLTRLGIFDMGSAFGNLKNLVGGDLDHGNGIELHILGGEDRLLALTGWDSDYDDEIEIIMNQQLLGGLPGAANNNWTNPYQLYLPQEYLNSGDNTILIHNKDSTTYNWGIRLDAIRSGNAPLGHKVPGTVVNHTDKVTYLVPGFTTGGTLNLSLYDMDYTYEVEVSVNNVMESCPCIRANNAWSQFCPITLESGMNIVDVDNTFNPPNIYLWGVKVTGWQ